LGVVIHNTISAEAALSFSNKVKILQQSLLDWYKMIIAPLVFTTLVVQIRNVSAVGRIGKALGWFFLQPLISLLLECFFVNVLEPGVGLNLSNVDLTSGSEVVAKLKVFLSKILNILFQRVF
jgi:Na+/H+-dicarboxylate symporter